MARFTYASSWIEQSEKLTLRTELCAHALCSGKGCLSHAISCLKMSTALPMPNGSVDRRISFVLVISGM